MSTTPKNPSHEPEDATTPAEVEAPSPFLAEQNPPLLSTDNTRFLEGDPVEIRIVDRGQDVQDKWRKGRYHAYFPQYGFHAVRLSDGSTWQGATKDIRIPGGSEDVGV